ncbi:MAG TPA: peptidoglycan-binding domain-containing protein [Candidatus Omnitrophota bacterium]|nr:peptidoglycan-binding domain-containing protein [Candidatus Omnitrophota bacterium]HPN56136.1 peptidoglycan-binding domain-containing protein [Candidatus Omnitrophota bacterium]
MIRGFFVLAFCALLTGCAAVDKNHSQELQECHNRVAYLEREIQEKDREISDLKYDLKRNKRDGEDHSAAPGRREGGLNSPGTPSVAQIQKALNSAGYYHGPIDGRIGAKTRAAIMKFQEDNGLKVDGKVGQMTWRELKAYLE